MTRSVHLGSALMYFMLTESAMWFSHFLSTSKQACQVVHVNILICVLYKTSQLPIASRSARIFFKLLTVISGAR